MNFDQAIKSALEQPTLEEALSWICVWESERVVKQAHEFLSGRAERQLDGRGWDTCFGICINRVMREWSAK